MKLKIKRLDQKARIPTYVTPGSGCFDLYSINEAPQLVKEAVPQTFGTGLAFEVPKDHVMLVFSRSGHGFNSDVRLANCVGVIDSDYRGEVKVKLTNDPSPNWNGFAVKQNDRIAQAMVIPVERVEFVLCDELSITERFGGFGSTGA